MRIYDHEDAMMYEEMLRDNASQDEEANLDQYEFPEVKNALPPCIEVTLERKWDAADRHLLSSHIHGPYGSWIQRLRAMERLSRVRVARCSELIEGNYDGPPLPSLILAFQEHDAVVACFDEESQGMLESSAEPTLCTVFSPDKPKEVDEAIRAVSRFVAFNAELFFFAEQLVALC